MSLEKTRREKCHEASIHLFGDALEISSALTGLAWLFYHHDGSAEQSLNEKEAMKGLGQLFQLLSEKTSSLADAIDLHGVGRQPRVLHPDRAAGE